MVGVETAVGLGIGVVVLALIGLSIHHDWKKNEDTEKKLLTVSLLEAQVERADGNIRSLHRALERCRAGKRSVGFGISSMEGDPWRDLIFSNEERELFEDEDFQRWRKS